MSFIFVYIDSKTSNTWLKTLAKGKSKVASIVYQV